MKFSQVILSALIGAIVALGSVAAIRGDIGSASERKETAYERVMRTNTIRCGYLFWTSFMEKDFKTGAYSGFYYDLMEEIGRQLNMKIEWTEEVTPVTMFSGLEMGRYDVACIPANATPGRARVAEFTLPVSYTPTYLYVRADDARFDNHYERINDPSIKVAVLEGELSQTIKKEDFPLAQTQSMSDIVDISQVLLQVSMGKADVAMTEPSSAAPFFKHNPGKLKRVPGPALRMQAFGVSVRPGEEALRRLLDTTIDSLYRVGRLKRIVEKYPAIAKTSYLPAKTWQE